VIDVAKLRQIAADLRQHDSIFWRRAIDAGVVHGPEAWVRYSPAFFGLAFGAALPRHRRAVLRNLRLALGPRPRAVELRDTAAVFVNFAACMTEAFVVSSKPGARLDGAVIGDENYFAAVAEKRGVIVATAHTGGWEISGMLLRSLHAADVMVVMQRERDERAQALHDDARQGAGVRVVRLGGDPLEALPLLAHLRKGGVVAIQVDRLPKGMRGRKARLFGAPWMVPEGPLALAAVSGAPIVPAFTRRLGFLRYEVLPQPAIHVPRRPSGAELDEAAGRLMREVERFVVANPTQWFHFEDFDPP
jgi:KDO2-lipid IV(A) lauroyltransferase